MNNLSRLVITALVFSGSISTASAAGVITSVSVGGEGMETFNIAGDGMEPNVLKISETFDSAKPSVLTFMLDHSEGGSGNPYAVTEAITNNTGRSWSEFHFTISEPKSGGQGDAFTNFHGSTLSGFTLDTPTSSEPRHLSFTGALADGNTATAVFNLSPFDPGAGNTSTLTLTLLPVVPEPETYAMLLAGLGMMGFIAKRRNNKQDTCSCV